MAPRSQLEIATGAVQRLIKEEASYKRELEQQKGRIQKLEAQAPSEDENRDYLLKQESAALAETKNVFPVLKTKI
ncbi:tubulin binding cofactor A, partial [Aspergillus californicus]